MIWVWRHPRPEGAQGRCIGAATDLPVHWRRAKRLARRVQALARKQRLPHCVYSSPLRRCADVAAWLGRWGWQVKLDARLRELDFGRWDGLPWSQIAQAEVDQWVQQFADYRPGGGEALGQLLARVQACTLPAGSLVISHGGWMLARRWLDQQAAGTPAQGPAMPRAQDWPRPPAYAQRWPLQTTR